MEAQERVGVRPVLQHRNGVTRRPAKVQVCYGCKENRREPWEHSPLCPEWARKEGCCSGT